MIQESKRIAILEKRAQEQFEKDKDEMLSKLKDLGNTVLGILDCTSGAPWIDEHSYIVPFTFRRFQKILGF